MCLRLKLTFKPLFLNLGYGIKEERREPYHTQWPWYDPFIWLILSLLKKTIQLLGRLKSYKAPKKSCYQRQICIGTGHQQQQMKPQQDKLWRVTHITHWMQRNPWHSSSEKLDLQIAEDIEGQVLMNGFHIHESPFY